MKPLNQIMKNVYSRQFSQLLGSAIPVSRRERVVAFLIFVIFAVAFCNYQLVTALLHHLDSAFLMEVLTSIKKTGVPTTHLIPSVLDAYTAGAFTTSAEVLCKADLITTVRGISQLENHAYYILYPLAAFTWVFPPHVILAVANGIGFVSIIFILYLVIRGQGVPILGAIVFCSLVMAHPAWAHASLGDFYADRFFMPLGLLYVFLLYNSTIQQSSVSRIYLPLTLAVGLLASSTTERGAIMVVSFNIAFLFFYRKMIADRGAKIVIPFFSMALLAYIFLYLKLIYISHAGNMSLSAFLPQVYNCFEMFQAPEYTAKAKEFIIINVLLFGIFALFNWRLALIAFAALLPNLLTTIGGAEKNGWATHYHSMYFPFLAFASAMGYSKLWNLLRYARYRMLLIGVLLFLIPAISNYSPGYGGMSGAVKRVYAYYVNREQSYEKQQSIKFKQIMAAVPVGANVTTMEGFVPTLYRGRNIYFYPMGIDTADYAVLNKVIQPDGSFYYAGAVSYIPGESQQIDICLTERLRKVGFNVDHPKLLVGNMVVLEHNKK